MYVLSLLLRIVSPCDQQEDVVLAWIFSIFMEAPKSQFQHEQFSEQLLAGKQITHKCLCGTGDLSLMAQFQRAWKFYDGFDSYNGKLQKELIKRKGNCPAAGSTAHKSCRGKKKYIYMQKVAYRQVYFH